VSPRLRAHTVTIVLLAFLQVAGVVAAEADANAPQTTFFRANALYKEGKYAEAVKEYEQLVHAGAESGPLYFNLGNAYFKAGDRGRAILSYERAARFMPRDPDLQANLSYSQSLTGATSCASPLWRRVVFPLSDRLSTQQLAWMSTALSTLLFLILAALRLWPQHPRWLMYVAATVAVLLVISGGSFAYRGLAERQLAAVVIRSEETPVRFEPADNGTVHYTLTDGSLIRVLEQREGWLQVERCDGRRGWIERSAVETL
jgi:tetratricopeptide (TPR) repeat protein